MFIGHSELSFYLQNIDNKSFIDFLRQYRSVIVDSLFSSSDKSNSVEPIQLCDNWLSRFLTVAKSLFTNISDFNVLSHKVRTFLFYKIR